MNVRKTLETLLASIKDPAIELHYTNPFTLLVAVILSAQCTDKRVNLVTKDLFKTVQTPKDILALGQANLEKAIGSINFFRAKAKNIVTMSSTLLDKFEGQVPSTLEDLRQLQGVGLKSASVILSVIFKKPYIVVDTHVFRVSHRLGWSSAPTPDKAAKDLDALIPENLKVDASQLLVLHGRYTCIARKPKCAICPIKADCAFYKNSQKAVSKKI